MMIVTPAEEKLLKAIFEIATSSSSEVHTNDLAHRLGLKPGSVTEALRRLSDKGCISYERYQPVRLTIIGKNLALKTLRRQRLWNAYLFSKMNFGLDELIIHSEQLGSIPSERLVDSLDELLGHPLFDPFGDPIPDRKGKMRGECFVPIDKMPPGTSFRVAAFSDHSEAFLEYIQRLGLSIGSELTLISVEAYDGSATIIFSGEPPQSISRDVARSILSSSREHCCAFDSSLQVPPCLGDHPTPKASCH